MRRFIPLITVTLIAALSALPLISSQTTCSDDGFFHIAKAVTLEQMIRDGQPFGRWSPEMAHGFGYPYFNYYAPLGSYLLIAIHSLGFIYPVALHILLALCIWTAGLGTYFFVRELWGEAAGVTASAVYITAPYFAFDLLFRAALAESLALVFPPLILYFTHKALTASLQPHSSREAVIRYFSFWSLLASLSLAALLYTHNITALVTLPLIIGYIALHLISFPKNFVPSLLSLRSLRLNVFALGNGTSIIVLGLALAARFWLPALAERTLVQSDKLLVPPIFTYYTNYITLKELLAFPAFIDPLIINPSPAKALGLVMVVLATVGFLAVTSKRLSVSNHQQSAIPFYFSLCLILYASLTLSFSQLIWDIVPLMSFIQFPWRLLGLASLCAAILSGAAVYGLPQRQWLLSGVVITIACLGHLSWWSPRYCAPMQEVTLANTIQYEFDTYTIGTSAKGEFLPNTVKVFPNDDSFGRALTRHENLNRLTGVPPTAKLTINNLYPINYQATIESLETTHLTFNQFYFPGWSATLDDQPLTLTPHPETGLITFTLPSGTHQLKINFGNTPIRTTGEFITLGAILIVLAYCIVRITVSRQPTAFSQQSSSINPPIIRNSSFVIIPLLLIGIRIFFPFTFSPFNGENISIGKPLNLQLTDGLKVLSVEYPESVESGSSFEVVLYLTPQKYTPLEFRPRIDLVTFDGFTVGNGDEAWVPRWHREPSGTQYWPVGQYAQWARQINIPAGTPPGYYALRANIFNRATLEPQSVVNDNGEKIAPYVGLGTIEVKRPTRPATNFKMQYTANKKFGNLTLLGYDMDRDAARGGDNVYFTFYLRADELPITNYKFNLFTPAYPFGDWQQGDVWQIQTKARVPVEAATAQYRFTLTALNTSYELAPINLIPVEHALAPPPIQNKTSLNFKNTIELIGYNRQENQIELVWKALGTPDQDLIAFIHVEDSTGKIIAQSDAVPANWSRPTTGWVAGEYIVDTRTLPPLPNNGITVYVGLSERESGQLFGDRMSIYKLP